MLFDQKTDREGLCQKKDINSLHDVGDPLAVHSVLITITYSETKNSIPFYLLGMAWNREIVFVVSFLDEIFLYRTREGLFLRFLHIWYAFDNRIVTLLALMNGFSVCVSKSNKILQQIVHTYLRYLPTSAF